MPLIEIRQLTSHATLGLWRISEEASTPRERERLAVRHLLHSMTGDETADIGHEPSGKPFLDTTGTASQDTSLSISHTKGYAALLLSDDGDVGIDIEYRSDRVERIAERFIRPDEPVGTTLEKLLLWSAKETVYKLFSADKLMFFDMRLLSFEESVMLVENRKQKKVVSVHFEYTDDYVLTYAVGQ